VSLTLDPSGATPIYQQVVEQVQRRVAMGTLLPGDPVPSVRQLALELTINPNTVARAYLELEYQGILHKRQGQGTYVSPGAVEALRREGAQLVAVLLARAVADAALFGIPLSELDALYRQAKRDASPAPGKVDTKDKAVPR
jgi:GntR family transcriptional regulator